jgi:transcriptional regulator with XRE-family HTH domain
MLKTPEQLRAARAFLALDQAELAEIAGLSVETIKRLEGQTGVLKAKIETIVALLRACEAKNLEFFSDHHGMGAGVRWRHPDKPQLIREALIREWAQMMNHWLKAQCATNPKYFEQDPKKLTEKVTKESAHILPTIIRSVLSDPPTGWDKTYFK